MAGLGMKRPVPERIGSEGAGMGLLLWLLLALVPFLLGKGTLEILYGQKNSKELSRADSYITGALVCIGIGEIAHLAAVIGGFTYTDSVRIFSVLAGGLCIVVVLRILRRRQKEKADSGLRREREKQRLRRVMLESVYSAAQQMTFVIFGLSVLLQIITIVSGSGVYRSGDMMLETVNSFQATNGIYQVNPLTGSPYLQGLPLRLEILSLPTLYGAVSTLVNVPARQVIWEMIPAAVLIGSYMAYSRLARTLFGGDATRKGVFLLLVSLVIWVGNYLPAMDGFGLLYAGYRGTSIRAGILLPFTICMCLQKKWKLVALCIVAEACIVWTFYGLGVCLLVTVLMLAVRSVIKFLVKKDGVAWNR